MIGEMWQRDPLPADLYSLSRTMRAADADEISLMIESRDWNAYACRLYRMLPYALYARVFGLDRPSRAILFVGIWPTNETRALGSAALFATDEFPLLAGMFVRHMRRFVVPAQLANGVRRVECRTLARYTRSHRLLRALGAVEETAPEGSPDYGPNGEAFKLFAWRRRDWQRGADHVLRVHTENAGDARSDRSGEYGGAG
jgi:hypothetical protein